MSNIGDYSELSPKEEAISKLYRYGVDVLAIRKGGASDKELMDLAQGLEFFAAKEHINLEEQA